jgi:hypothetical protein
VYGYTSQQAAHHYKLQNCQEILQQVTRFTTELFIPKLASAIFFFGNLTKTKCVLSLPVTKSCSELQRTILKQSSHIYSAMADKLVTLT